MASDNQAAADQSFICEFCSKSFTCIGNLNRHAKTSKLCLELRGMTLVSECCADCGYKSASLFNFERHLESCKCRKIRLNRNRIEEQKLETEKNLIKEHIEEKKVFENHIIKLEAETNIMKELFKAVHPHVINFGTLNAKIDNSDQQTSFRVQQNFESKNEDEIASLTRFKHNHEKRHHYVKFETDQPSYYVFSYGRRCQAECILNHMKKHGIAIKNKKGSGILDSRLRNHRTTFKWLTLEFVVSAPANIIELLEKTMEARFGDNLNPNSSEVFEGLSLTILRSTALAFLDVACPNNYHVLNQDKIDEYNHDVNEIIKENIDSVPIIGE